MSILEKANRIPPCLCRLSARRGGHLLSTREVALISGIPKSTVDEISKMTDWNSVPLGVIERYTKACGVDLLRSKRTTDYLKRRMGPVIRKSDSRTKRMIAGVFRKLRSQPDQVGH